jgi:hypothetical protein
MRVQHAEELKKTHVLSHGLSTLRPVAPHEVLHLDFGVGAHDADRVAELPRPRKRSGQLIAQLLREHLRRPGPVQGKRHLRRGRGGEGAGRKHDGKQEGSSGHVPLALFREAEVG